MEESDIEIWFDEEKEKALAVYKVGLEKNQDRKELEKNYKERMKKSREVYEKLYEKKLNPNKLAKYTEKIRGLMDKLVDVYKE